MVKKGGVPKRRRVRPVGEMISPTAPRNRVGRGEDHPPRIFRRFEAPHEAFAHVAIRPELRSTCLESEPLYHRWLDEPGVEGEEDEEDVEAVAGVDRGFDAGIDGGAERRVGGLGEGLGTDHAGFLNVADSWLVLLLHLQPRLA